jgi:hypothetical protein
MTQPDVSALARKWKLDVDISGTWTLVKGMRELKPMLTPDLEDDGVYDDGGWGSSTKTGLVWTAEGTVVRRYSAANDTVYDPGQEQLRIHAETFGAAGVAHVRWYDRNGGPEAYEGYAEVSWVAAGGSRTDLETAEFVLTGRGARTTITNPDL